MLEDLKNITDYDIIFFTPGEDDGEDDTVAIRTAQYKQPGEKLEGSSSGDAFEIVLFRLSEEELVIDLDRFTGILIEPREYVSRMIKSDWYGMVARKTTTSASVVSDVFASWAEN